MRRGWRCRALSSALALLGALGLAAGCGAPRLDLRPVAVAGDQSLEMASAPSPYERGKQHLQEGRFGFALQAFRAALVQDPYSVRTLNALAVSYDQLGRRDLAQHFFGRALDVDPRSAQTLNNLGYSALRRGDGHAAITYFHRALLHDAGNVVVLANLEAAGTYLIVRPQPQFAAAAKAPPIRRAGWVERTSAFVQTIVTQPDPALLDAAARLGVEPRLASYHR